MPASESEIVMMRRTEWLWMTSHPDPDPFRPVAFEPREGYRIWLRYADGVESEVELSHLVGIDGSAAWRGPDFFSGVHIADRDGIAWSGELDLCPDALYLQNSGKSPEDIWPALKEPPEIPTGPPARKEGWPP